MPHIRPCLDCRHPAAPSSSRCRPCGQAKKRWRNADRATAKAVVAASPFCAVCGSTEDLTADHVIPGGAHDGPRQTLCRRCNSSKRDRA